MSETSILIFDAANILNGSGEQVFGPTDINSNSSNVAGDFNVGADTGTLVTILDSDSGPNASLFNDGTTRQQFLNKDITLTYEQEGSTITSTFPAGTQVQAEFTIEFSGGTSIVALRFEDPNNSGELVTAGYAVFDESGTPAIPAAGTNLGTDTGGNNNGVVDYSDVACFCAGTLIETDRGQVPVEKLRFGDMIRTMDRGFQPVQWIGHTELSPFEVMGAPHLAPYTIAGGVRVSPQHRVMISSPHAEMLFDSNEVLVAAKHLPDAVQEKRVLGPLHYIHLGFEEHHIIFANGVAVESLLSFDDLDAGGDEIAPDAVPARPILRRFEADVLFSAMEQQDDQRALKRA